MATLLLRRDRPARMPRTAGFTLFEITVSLAVMAVAVVSTLMVFTVGVKAQHLARYQMYASAKVLEISHNWADLDHSYLRRQVEAENLGQTLFQGFQNNLDQATGVQGGKGFGLVPLPDALARRLDSDGDEIQRILDQGGQVFYSWPRATTRGTTEWWDDIDQSMKAQDAALDSEQQSLIYAVTGLPQQDALPNHPCLAWPYHDDYPSPPHLWEKNAWEINRAAWGGYSELEEVFALAHAGQIIGSDGADPLCPSDLIPYTQAGIDDYLQRCQALVAALGIPLAGGVPASPAPLPPPPWSRSDREVYPPPAWILALRYLAHAALLRTGTNPGVSVAPADRIYAQDCHAAMLAWLMRYASTDPYDWGAPRPLNRMTAWDYPLLQSDLFPSSAFPSFAATDGTGDVSWRVIGGQPARNVGRARGQYANTGQIPDNNLNIAASWGDPAHFDLCAPFAAAERMRQIVCWSVDWKSYEDFELQPAATVDSRSHSIDSRGNQVSGYEIGIHPEIELFFDDATRARLYVFGGRTYNWDAQRAYLFARPELWMGDYGADRNGNGVFDRGELPISARMRAVRVARFNFYDKRLIGSLRN